ncbi:MAG: hypothetical protein ACK4PR_11870 [Gammaproteobacteria bacterium]
MLGKVVKPVMDKLFDKFGVSGTAALFTAGVGAVGFWVGMRRINQEPRMIQNNIRDNRENSQCNLTNRH